MGIDTRALAARDLERFAADNGWRYDARATPPAVGAGLWERATSGGVQDRISGDGWEAGLLTGSAGPAREVRRGDGWTLTTTVTVNVPGADADTGYLAIRLPRRLPHLLLDARANDRFGSSLRNPPRADQRLSLEGDFDRHFRLYAPRGYERDALYVFTPDLMALLVDETGDLDVEVRDDVLLVYRPGGFDMLDPSTWERFERIRETVGAKTWSRTDLYIDDRTAAPSLMRAAGPREVAPGGQRLRRRVPRWALLLVGLVVLPALAAVGVVAALLAVFVLQ